MDYLIIILRVVFFYFFIVLIYRLMGKREVGQLGIIDLIVSILIAELVVISVEDTSISIWKSVVPVSLLAILEMLLSFLSLKSMKIRNILDGSPSVIIDKGRLNYHEMVKQKYNLDDLLSQLRERGFANLEDVEYAILENNGTLSVFDKRIKQIPLPIILEGIIQVDNLKYINRRKEDIFRLLGNNNIKDVFYAFIDNNRLYLIKYSDIK